MSAKDSNTTYSGIEWNAFLGLLVQLRKANLMKDYLLIGTGAYLGLRASDLLDLHWSYVLDKDEVIVK